MKLFSFLILLLLFLPVFIYAQPLPPSTPVPLDGGLIALLAAGAVYGVKRYSNNNSKTE